jgi:hypothetical protein
MSLNSISIQAVNRLNVTHPDARSGEDSKRLVATDLVRLIAQQVSSALLLPACFEALLGFHEVAATPWNAKAKAAPIGSTAVPSLCHDNPAKPNAPIYMNINSLLSHLLSNIAQVYFELFNTLSKVNNPNIRRTRGARNFIPTCKRGPDLAARIAGNSRLNS